jgi:hypothetical protein
MKSSRFAALLIGVASGLALPSLAFAHGASRLKLIESIEINAPAAKVWKVVGNFDNMGWLPNVVKTTGTGGDNPDAKRVLTLKGGAKINESLYKYDPDSMSYSYYMDKVDVKILPVTNYSATLVVIPEGNKSKVEWRGAFFRGDPLFDPPPALNDDAATKAVTTLYVSGLASLKQKIEAGEATN